MSNVNSRIKDYVNLLKEQNEQLESKVAKLEEENWNLQKQVDNLICDKQSKTLSARKIKAEAIREAQQEIMQGLTSKMVNEYEWENYIDKLEQGE